MDFSPKAGQRLAGISFDDRGGWQESESPLNPKTSVEAGACASSSRQVGCVARLPACDLPGTPINRAGNHRLEACATPPEKSTGCDQTAPAPRQEVFSGQALSRPGEAKAALACGHRQCLINRVELNRAAGKRCVGPVPPPRRSGAAFPLGANGSIAWAGRA